jgi:hypothetical protein
MTSQNIVGIIGIGIILLGVIITSLFFRKRMRPGTARSLVVLIVGIPLGIGLVYLTQFILNQVGIGYGGY